MGGAEDTLVRIWGGMRYPTEDEGAEDTPLRIWGLKIPHTCPDTPEMGMLMTDFKLMVAEQSGKRPNLKVVHGGKEGEIDLF